MAKRAILWIVSRLGLVAFGAGIGLLALVSFDFVLEHGGFDVGEPPPDPFAGFSSTQSKFVPVTLRDGTLVYRPRPDQRRRRAGSSADPSRVFEAEKAPNTFRIFVVGGSSAEGTPYGTEYSFGAWLEQRLNATTTGVEWEVVNAAFSGYATRRIIHVAREITRYSPDLLIIYGGHNEFAEQRFYRHLLDRDPRLFRWMELVAQTHIYRWWYADAEVEQPPKLEIDEHYRAFEMFAVMAERAGGGVYPTGRERAFGEIHFEYNLRQIVRIMHEAGVPTMLLTLSQNLADWEPGASAHGKDLDERAIHAWETHSSTAEAKLATDCEAATRHLRTSLAIDEGYALTHYQLATCLRKAGRYDEARQHFARASDLDQIPQGASSIFNEVIRRVALSEDAILVDTAAVLEQASPHRLVGSNFFVDFVHPNIEAHQMMARAIAATIREQDVFPGVEWGPGTWQETPVDRVYAQQPELRVNEHVALGLACMLSLRKPCVRDAANATLAIDPTNRAARDYLSMLETSSVWSLGSAMAPWSSLATPTKPAP